MKQQKISENEKDQWREFPHLRLLWNTGYLLFSQSVDYSQSQDDIYSYHMYQGIYTDRELVTTHSIDLAISRGVVKSIIKYNGTSVLEHTTSDIVSVKIFTALHVTKFNGIISLEFSDNIVKRVKLSPNREIIRFYDPVMSRYLKKYYNITD